MENVGTDTIVYICPANAYHSWVRMPYVAALAGIRANSNAHTLSPYGTCSPSFIGIGPSVWAAECCFTNKQTDRQTAGKA